MSHRHADILIVGGGPAGAAAAISLARLGHSPLLIAAPRRQAAFEGFSRRTVQALKTLGFCQAPDAVGAEIVREVIWNGVRSRVNTEFVVDRHRFDCALLADVRGHGVEVLRDRVTRASRLESRWHVQLSSSQLVTADFLIEARGRAARVPSTARLQGPATVSLARRWTGVDEAAGTAVAAMRNGWMWYANTGGGRAILQILVAADSGDVPKRARLVEFYDGMLSDCGEARSWVGDGRASDGVVVRHANPVCARKPFAEDMIRVGDAAVAPDPLSGHGVYVALGGAQAAATAVNTLLRRPENATLAKSFYEERCQLDFLRLCRIGRGFYDHERRWPDSPFWMQRRNWPDLQPPHAPMNSHPPRIERRPVVEDGFIVEHDVIVTPDHPRGVWVVDDVPLVPLYRTMTDTGGPRDIRQLAGRLNKPAASVRLAAEWLKHRFEL